MEKKIFTVFFVDRINYTNLLDVSFNINDFENIFFKNNSSISQLTRSSLIFLNKQLKKLFHHPSLSDNFDNFYDDLILLSKQERQYIEDNFKSTMLENSNTYSRDLNKKYYEIIVLSNNTLLIVIEEGFLKFMTESKDNLIKFILNCLCYSYKFNFVVSYLLKTYISLKMNDTYFNLIKSRYF
jgi:hypothetical protein